MDHFKQLEVIESAKKTRGARKSQKDKSEKKDKSKVKPKKNGKKKNSLGKERERKVPERRMNPENSTHIVRKMMVHIGPITLHTIVSKSRPGGEGGIPRN